MGDTTPSENCLTEDDLKEIFDIGELRENISADGIVPGIPNEDASIPEPPPRRRASKVEFSPDNIKNIYSELSELINMGKDILGNVQYLISSNSVIDPEMIASAASLINAVQSMLKEFNKVHMQHVKFEQMKEFELMKAKERRKVLKYKVNEAKKLLGKGDEKDITGSTIVYCQEEIINSIVQSEQKQISGIVEK